MAQGRAELERGQARDFRARIESSPRPVDWPADSDPLEDAYTTQLLAEAAEVVADFIQTERAQASQRKRDRLADRIADAVAERLVELDYR